MTIVEFLLARIAEDEAEATRAPTSWLYPEDYPALEMGEMGPGHTLIISPTRVLAECQAKRAIIESVTVLTGDQEKTYAERLAHTEAEDARYQITRDILVLLAAVYADHPDYREEWKP